MLAKASDPIERPLGVFPREACGIWQWYSHHGSPERWDGRVGADTYPGMKGVPVVVGWNELEPRDGDFQWRLIDDVIERCAANGLYIFSMVWYLPPNPEWLYEKGVPRVEIDTFKTEADGEFAHIPYPFSDQYEFYFHRAIDAVADHMRSLPPPLRKWYLFHQGTTGSTGDGYCYKGQPKDPKYAIPRDEWDAYCKKEALYQIRAFTGAAGGKPPIPLLINALNDEEWLARECPAMVLKNGVGSHFYQSNTDKTKFEQHRPWMTNRNSLKRPVFIRGEGETAFMDQTRWFQKNPLMNFYWSALYALHMGIDIWNVGGGALEMPELCMAFDTFNRYAGQKIPSQSPVAFCALRDNLNADDTERFPEDKYGKYTLGKVGKRETKIDDFKGASYESNRQRVEAILKEFAPRGAVVEAPSVVLASGMESRRRKGHNDVGRDRIEDNYCRFLHQIDANETSVGWWHIGPPYQPYGRFARGFDSAAGKNAICLAFDEDFFAKEAPGKLKIRVTWLDRDKSEWKLVYDAKDNPAKTAMTVKGSNYGRWRTEIVVIEDAAMRQRGERGSDIALLGVSGDAVFHLVDVERI
ncbi:MAG: beta-galactosidase [Candidatus Sumerlaeota bacterium]|nr:beta-galactosidase [Candidatus Sumerlaeota bacterium]